MPNIFKASKGQQMGPRKALTLAALSVAALAAAVPGAALAGTANKGLPGAPTGNPIANLAWGHYTGTLDDVYPDYRGAKPSNKKPLAELALRPEAYWFGSWNPKPKGASSSYIQDVTHGNKNVMVSLTDFRMGPWENKACGVVPSASAIAQYKTWQKQFAAGIAATRALVVLQPDLPIAGAACIPSRATAIYHQEVAFAAKTLNAKPYTTVYIDAGSSDWLTYQAAAALLAKSGIKHARGFALNATHFDSTDHEIAYGQKIVRALAARGIKGKHFIVDTAENGHPFTHQQYTNATGSGAHWATRPACTKTHKARFCQTFGIPPTWKTGSAAWRLGKRDSAAAAKLVDGYVWFGRPWMKGQSSPFEPSLAEQMAKSTPFPYSKFPEPTPSVSKAAAHAALRWPASV